VQTQQSEEAAAGTMGKPSGGTPPDKSRKRPSLSSEDGPPRKPATAFGAPLLFVIARQQRQQN